MSFFLFLLVNATLYLRPAEIVPDLLGLPIYNFLIITCFAFALPEIMAYLSGQTLDAQPITLGVFALLLAATVASVANLPTDAAASAVFEFFKAGMYFVLFVSVVNTPARLRQFIMWITVFCLFFTVIAVLQFHEVIRLPTYKGVLIDSDTDRATGLEIRIARLQGSGSFQDPNEFCLILATTVPLTLYALMDVRFGLFRLLWLGQLGLFGYAISLTESRGGLLAFLGGLGMLAAMKFGWRRAVLLGLLGLPILFIVKDRQTDFMPTEGTSMTRIQMWSDWMMEFRASPLLGKGMTVKDDNPLPGQEVQLLAHNSYLQAFADLGILGGMLFLGLFYLAVWTLFRTREGSLHVLDPEMRRLQPYLLAAVAAYGVGLLGLSLVYFVPTYMVLGLAAAYARVVPLYPPAPILRFDGKVMARFAVASVAFLAFLYVFVRFFIRWT